MISEFYKLQAENSHLMISEGCIFTARKSEKTAGLLTSCVYSCRFVAEKCICAKIPEEPFFCISYQTGTGNIKKFQQKSQFFSDFT